MKHIILVILLTLGVWGQEVGVPYVDTREAIIQHNCLSLDGSELYTFDNSQKILTHWNLEPVKVLDVQQIAELNYKD